MRDRLLSRCSSGSARIAANLLAYQGRFGVREPQVDFLAFALTATKSVSRIVKPLPRTRGRAGRNPEAIQR